MVQTAEDRRSGHLGLFRKGMSGGDRPINVSNRVRNARTQAGAWATSIVVRHPLTEHPSKIGFVQRDQLQE